MATPSGLLRGVKRSCGCLQDEARRLDITGQKRGQLTAVRPTNYRYHVHSKQSNNAQTEQNVRDQIEQSDRDEMDQRSHGHTIWEWRCSCGRLAYKTPQNVGEGQSTMFPECAKALKSQ